MHRIRLLATALAVALVGSIQGLHVQAAAMPFGTTLIPGAAWAGPYASMGDLNVYSNGNGTQDRPGPYGSLYECTELAVRWAAIRYGVSPGSWNAHAAWMMYDDAARLPVPFEALPNGGAAPPRFGDILVFDRTSFDPTGHVAVVSATGPGHVDIVEQNWGNDAPAGSARLPIIGTTMPARWGLTIRGWIRASSVPFVQSLYRDVLGRPADAGGVTYWSGALDAGLSRQDLALRLENSPEGRAHFVDGEYRRLLHRPLDPGGAAFWADFLASHTVQQFEAAVIAPREYYTTRGHGTDKGFVTALYTDTLGRAPDARGRAYYLSLLAGGVGRERIANMMVWSPEGLAHRVNIMYRAFLRRRADPGGLAFSAGVLAGMTPVQQMAASFLASDEYVARANSIARIG